MALESNLKLFRNDHGVHGHPSGTTSLTDPSVLVLRKMIYDDLKSEYRISLLGSIGVNWFKGRAHK